GISHSPGIVPETVQPLAIVGRRHEFQSPEVSLDRYWKKPEPCANTLTVGGYVSTGERIECLTNYRVWDGVNSRRGFEARPRVNPYRIVNVLPELPPLDTAAGLQSHS